MAKPALSTWKVAVPHCCCLGLSRESARCHQVFLMAVFSCLVGWLVVIVLSQGRRASLFILGPCTAVLHFVKVRGSWIVQSYYVTIY